jgi:hypothetical protein
MARESGQAGAEHWLRAEVGSGTMGGYPGPLKTTEIPWPGGSPPGLRPREVLRSWWGNKNQFIPSPGTSRCVKVYIA